MNFIEYLIFYEFDGIICIEIKLLINYASLNIKLHSDQLIFIKFNKTSFDHLNFPKSRSIKFRDLEFNIFH